MKILIVHPEFNDPGGVSNYFKILNNKFGFTLVHFITGKRVLENNYFGGLSRIIRDYIRFIQLLNKEQYDLVHINPSLNFKGLVRDGLFIILAKYFRRRVLVFFHGWEKVCERNIRGVWLWLFLSIYRKVDAFIVLSLEFKERLTRWGVSAAIYTETTAVDDDLLKDLDIGRIVEKRISDSVPRILFLSRIIREKGIYTMIDAYSLLKIKFPRCELMIAGDGTELQAAREYVRNNGILDVDFTGYIKSDAKRDAFLSAYVYCFPTYYEEGMPISLLEAMAFGLPVVTRPVGGVADFFENGIHGYSTTSKDATVFADFIEKLFLDKELYKKISLYNYTYAQKRFLASKVARRLEKIYEEILEH